MSASLVRGAHLARSVCSACAPCQLRLYSSHALLLKPVTIAEVFAHTAPSTSSRRQLVPVPTSDDCHSTEHKSAEVLKKKRGREKKVIIQDVDHSRNPLEDNGIEAYLNVLKTTGVEPTLEDLERCRPLRRYRGLTQQYEEQFEALVDRLCRSFSRSQLRSFCAEYKLEARSNTPKKKLALLIVEKRWKWPSMDDLRRKKMEETKIEELVYPVVPSQLFLILGKDGIELLRMSQKYNVHISLKADPLQLQIEGVKQSVEKLRHHLTRRTESIVEKIFELPTKAPIRPDLIQRLSRLADAFIQNVGEEGQVRICALNHNHLLAAQRLATRAACEMAEYSQEQRLIYIPPGAPSSTPIPISLFPHSYSLYPFLSPRSLPWTMNTSGAFRIRRVGEWLASNATEEVQKTGGLAEGRGHLLATDETASNVEGALFSPLDETDAPSVGRSRSVTASLGHMLLTSTSTEQRATIAPPLTGTWVISKIWRWLQTADVKTAFVPSLPAPMSNASPACQKMLLRLIYHAISASSTMQATSMIKLEVMLPQPEGYHSNQAEETSELLDQAPVAHSDYEGWGDLTTPKSPPSMSESASDVLEFSCWKGQQTSVHIFMPDRPMDIRFSAFDSCEVPHAQLPPSLRTYLNALSAFMSSQDLTGPQPKAPLILKVDGQAYILNSYSSVLQNVELLQDLAETKSIGSEIGAVGVLSESVTDLENRHKMMHCQVTCQDHRSPLNWKEFLHRCDHLSSMSYRPVVGFSRMGAQDLISATEAGNRCRKTPDVDFTTAW